MNIMIGDTIVTDDREIGIVENRSGNSLTVRFPDYGNRRDQIHRSQTRHQAFTSASSGHDKQWRW